MLTLSDRSYSGTTNLLPVTITAVSLPPQPLPPRSLRAGAKRLTFALQPTPTKTQKRFTVVTTTVATITKRTSSSCLRLLSPHLFFTGLFRFTVR